MRREWIEIPFAGWLRPVDSSPSMRREWIEMQQVFHRFSMEQVSLHAEGVD